ncbi:hypothetical protein Tco_0574182 [Tanacetum coccineum]
MCTKLKKALTVKACIRAWYDFSIVSNLRCQDTEEDIWKYAAISILVEFTINWTYGIGLIKDTSVPYTERAKIRPTNVRLETTVNQKEETFQVIIDVIKNSTCFMAFTIFADVPEIFMHQFWYTIKKVKDSESYEFLLANKKCIVDVEVFRNILDIYRRVDRENVDYPELIWEDIAFQIDHRKEKRSRIREDYQEYGLPIPDMMLNDKIKQSESYQMFIKYFIGQIPPKRQRFTGEETYRKRTASRRVVKNKVTIAVDNIIPNPYVALELGKSISLTKAAEEEAARQFHATHAKIMTESVHEPARRRPSGIAFRDTSRTMQSSKESKKTSRRQPSTGGLSEGTGRIPGVPDESTIISATSSKGTSTKPGVPNEEKVTTEANKDDVVDDKSIDLEMTNDEETEDEFVHYDEKVNDDKDEEMMNAEVKESGNGDEEYTDEAKTDAEKTEEVKDDAKKAELPPTSSSLSDTTDAKINSLLDIKIQSEVPHIQSPSVLTI